MSAEVAVLGLGKMGAAIATALLATGRRTAVWNRTAARAEPLVARGAQAAGSAADALRASPLAIVALGERTLGDYTAVRTLLEPHHEALAGRTVVNLTSGRPTAAQTMAEWVISHGGQYLDGAMMAVPQTVGTATGFFLYSGSEAAFTKHRAILDELATSHYLGEDPAVAELWDLALLGTGYATLTGFLHSVAMLDTAQVTPSRFLPLATQWLHSMLEFLPELAGEIETGDYSEGVSPVSTNQAAVEILVDTSVRRGVDASVHAPLRALLDRRAADGHGDDSFASLVELLRAGR